MQPSLPCLWAFVLPCCLAAACLPAARAEDWPGFRGPRGDGISAEKGLPLAWGGTTGENVLWSAELLGEGVASPVVCKGRVFVLNASRKADDQKAGRKYPEQYLACYDAEKGKLLWNTAVEAGPWKRGRNGRPGGGLASCTPVTDGERVYGLFGTSVLAALDYSGKLVWRQELKPHNYDQEMATSPVLHGETVIVFCGMRGGSRLVAFGRRTGKVVWDRGLKDTGYGHNTPLLIDVKGEPRLVLMGAGLGQAKNAIQGFDPRTGERLWWCAGKGETASAVPANGLVYCDSGRGGPGKLIDPAGKGDVTRTHVRREANVPQGLNSPLVVGGHLYRLHDSKVLSCYDLKTGEKAYQRRVNQLSSTWASPVADASGNVYLASAGTSLVIKAGPKFELLATNRLDDPNHASPAIAGGRIYLLGAKRLYAIGKKE